MALPTRPLAILDACGTTRSIAREVDGNATGPKTLETLGDTAFGAGAHAMSDFEGFSNNKIISYDTYYRFGSCGQPGNVINCSCLVSNPSMVLGDGFTATFCYCLNNQENPFGGIACACFTLRCNNVIIAQCFKTTVGVLQGTANVTGIDYNDVVTSTVLACASALGCAGDTAQACTSLVSLTSQTGSGFVVGAPSENFVISVKSF